uniref:Adenine deaminase n=1 Tax=Bionectria ochroleuca TaxID=29856 RepID=A0A0B7K9H3_BIOOC
MCKSKLHSFLQALPKCEHHVHIEGTLSPEMLFSLAAKNGVKLSSDDPAFASPDSLRLRYQNFTSLDDFLRYSFIGFEVLLTASDFEVLTYEYLKKAYAQTVRHTEVFFDPQVHIARGVSYQTLLSGMNTARERAARDFPQMSVAFIPCLVRHLPVSSAHDLVSEILSHDHFKGGTLVGFGMSSTEVDRHHCCTHRSLRQAGVENLTAHYGEEGPPEYVAAALSDLGVKRIDHGRRAMEDPLLVRQLIDTKAMLTICPISNVVLRGVQDVKDLPIRQFLDSGVSFSINSDDPAYFGGSLLDNYCAVQEAFNLSMGNWKDIARNSVEGSWCSDARKRILMNMIGEAFSDVTIPNE